MNLVNHLLARLQEPGSIRSLVLILFLLKGQTVDDATVDQIANGLLLIISMFSFWKPETSTQAVPAEVLGAVNETKTQLGELTQAVQETKGLVDSITSLVRR